MNPLIAQILWCCASLILASAFFDTLAHTLPRRGLRYVISASKERLVLGLVEVAITVTALLVFLVARSAQTLWGYPPPSVPVHEDGLRFLRGALPLAGAGLALLGALLAGWAKVNLGRHFTANLGVKEGHALVRSGPFAYLRHPIYFGILLFAAGSGLVWNSIAFVLAAVGFLACFAFQMRVEDRILHAHFGRE
jgi:protein-S-isoprenylcysteine O-methyltransferase Ste14